MAEIASKKFRKFFCEIIFDRASQKAAAIVVPDFEAKGWS